jgi:putative FmdB family regulatory protein
MPTYEYQCKTCGHQFEQVQRFSDPPLTECPKCSGQIRRVIFPAGVIFKGSGWYITDSRKGSTTETGDKADKGDTAAKSDTSAPAESKPAEKAATSTEDR